MKCIVFDLDGTLVHSVPTIAHHGNLALKAFGYSTIPVKDYEPLLGNGTRHLIHEMLAAQNPPDFSKEEAVFNTYMASYMDKPSKKTEIYPGIEDLVSTLKVRGLALCVNSNKPDIICQKLVKALFGPDAFDLILGQIPGIAHKPDPAGIRRIMDQIGAKPEKTLYVGDTEVDFETAKNAGTGIILCDWGFRPRKDLERLDAPIISQASALLDYL